MPSDAQKRAIDHLHGPAIITAGPGSGKTFTIINRILYLIRHHHIPPDHILVITYTKAAAMEMKDRYEKACQTEQPSYVGVHFGTFHSICYNILKSSGVVSANSLIKENDKRKLLQIILSNNGFSSKCTYDTISNLENLISRMKNLTVDFADEHYTCKNLSERNVSSSAEFTDAQLKILRQDYDRHLREQGLIDFEDMIGECFQLLSGKPGLLDEYRQIFRYILADEFQDINQPQYELLKLLSAPENNLFVVGDDDQAIYGFRGAAPGIMKGFLNDFEKARQIMLTENYRCGANIVRLSEKVIIRNKERFSKEFRPMKEGGQVLFIHFDTRKEEEQRLIKELSLLNKEQLSDTAIILRTNVEAAQYAGLLEEASIPVKGLHLKEEDIYHSFLMEDVTAFLAFLYEGNSRSNFIRFMNKPNRFITRAALCKEKVKPEQMKQYYSQNPAMCAEIDALFGQLKIAAGLKPYLAAVFFRKTFGYDRYLQQKAKDYREYRRFLSLADKVQDCFKELKPGVPVYDFVKDMSYKTGNPVPQMEAHEGVSILTMHGSKGLEFERVFLPDVNEGIIPGKNVLTENALEEERRLLYVAMTRAKENLTIYCTRERGRKPSRFLEGLV